MRRLLLVLIVALCAGCSSIPTTGPVISGQAGDDRAGQFQLIPEGPRAGASPQDVVTGFIQAAVGFSNDHRVARSFLTPQRQLTWRPDDTVAVYPTDASWKLTVASGVAAPAPSTPAPGAQAAAGQAHPDATTSPPTPGEAATVTVRTPVEATMDDDGRYTLQPPGTVKNYKFTVVRNNSGDWRISGVENGILINQNDFGITFRPYAVYFPDPTGRYLVPDLHWFPSSRDFTPSPELPTALVRVLLEGPPQYLQGAVTTAVPPQTRMALAAVVVNDDVATVDLTEEVRAADTRRRQLLLAQLEATLGQLSTITQVKITVQRSTFDVPVSSEASTPITDPIIDGRPVLIDSRGRIARLYRGEVQVVGGLSGLALKGASSPAVAGDSQAYAVLDAGHDKLLVQMPGATKAVLAVRSSGLTAPSFDPEGRVWTASATGGKVFVADTTSSATRVKATWLKKYTVVALRISRDGTRAALAVRDARGAHVLVAGVLRDSAGRPASLTAPLGLLPALTSVSALTWVDEDHLAVLGRRTGSPGAQPWVVQVGGDVTGFQEVPGAVSLTAGNGESSLLAATTSKLYTRVGARWSESTPGKDPAYPG